MQQVRDPLIDHAINGVPQPIVANGAIVGERRRFNRRTMMWVLDRGRSGGASGPAIAPELDDDHDDTA